MTAPLQKDKVRHAPHIYLLSLNHDYGTIKPRSAKELMTPMRLVTLVELLSV